MTQPPSQMDYRRAVRPFQQLTKAYWEMSTPVVSAVNGTTAGMGWMMALLADLVVAAEGARWTHVFARRGMVPHAGDPFFMPRVLSFHRLNEAMLLSDTHHLRDAGGVGLRQPARPGRRGRGHRGLGLAQRSPPAPPAPSASRSSSTGGR